MKKFILLIVISVFSLQIYAQSALSMVNNSKNANELRQILEANSNELNLDMSFYNQLSEGYKTAVASELLANRPQEGFAKIEEVSFLFNSLSQLRLAMQNSMESAKTATFQIQHLEDIKLCFQQLIGYSVSGNIVTPDNLEDLNSLIDMLNELNEKQYNNFRTDLANNSFKYTGFTKFSASLFILSYFRFLEQLAIDNINNNIINSEVFEEIIVQYNFFSQGGDNTHLINGKEISSDFMNDFYEVIDFINNENEPFHNIIMKDVKNNIPYESTMTFVPFFIAIKNYHQNVGEILAAAENSKLAIDDFLEGGMVYIVNQSMLEFSPGTILNNEVIDEVINNSISFMTQFSNLNTENQEFVLNALNGKIFDTYKDFINAALAALDAFKITNITKTPEAKYTNLTAAINDATAGDELLIEAGIFKENITINKTLTLTGNINDPASVVISNENANPTITVTKNNVILRGVSITNNASNSSSIKLSGALGFKLNKSVVTAEQGNGIYIENKSQITISENIIKDNGLSGILYNENVQILSGSIIEYNRIMSNNSYNINSLSSETVTATCNWWGSSDKEAIEDKLNGDVTFITYLINNNINPETAQCTGSGEVASDNTLNVIDLYNDIKDISVCENTSLADAIKALAKSIVISDMDGNEYDVNLSWTITNYANGSPGVYSAKATFNLPTEIKQTTPPTTLEVYAIVTVNELPTVVCPEDMIITEKTPIELSASPEGGVFSGNGVNNNVFNPQFLSNGDYTITYTYTDMQTSCTNSCQFTIHLDISVGIENKENSFSTVYPNPSNGNFSIELKHSNFDYTIYNTNGVVLYKGSAFDKIDINTELPAGIYFLKINSNSYHNMKKIVIN